MGLVTVAKYERQVYIGAYGSTAATQLLTLLEANVNKDKDYDPTFVRGDGLTIPMETMQAVMRKCNVTFKCRNKKSDANTATLLAAAIHSSNPILALKVVSYATGATEFDGDVNLTVNDPDSRELEFTAIPTLEGGRAPSF